MQPPALAHLSRLPKFRQSGTDRWFACCPVHEERTASLRIVLKDGKLLMVCFGCGARAGAIIAKLGLPWSSLWIDGKAPTRVQRQADRGLSAWRERELILTAERLRAKDAILRYDWSHTPREIAAALLHGACAGYGKLEGRFEALRVGTKDEVLELWRER